MKLMEFVKLILGLHFLFSTLFVSSLARAGLKCDSYDAKTIIHYSKHGGLNSGHMRYEVPVYVALNHSAAAYELLVRYKRNSWNSFCSHTLYLQAPQNPNWSYFNDFTEHGDYCETSLDIPEPPPANAHEKKIGLRQWRVGMDKFPGESISVTIKVCQ